LGTLTQTWPQVLVLVWALAFQLRSDSGLWSVAVPVGYLKGGDTLRLLHGHSGACLTLPPKEPGEELQRSAGRIRGGAYTHILSTFYEGKAALPREHFVLKMKKKNKKRISRCTFCFHSNIQYSIYTQLCVVLFT